MYTIRIYSVNSFTWRETIEKVYKAVNRDYIRYMYARARRDARKFTVRYDECRMVVYRDGILLQSESWWNHTCWTGETTRLHNVHTAPHRQHT